MKNKILKLLKENDGFISGQKLSEEFGMTRTAIWKYINALKEDGYEIESISRRGYKLVSSPDLLSEIEIKKYLKTQYIGNEIINLPIIDSTNSYAKLVAFSKEEGTIITAEQQISGKGRLGRNWSSPISTGIYMSVILKPNLDPTKVSKLTLIGAAAVCKGLKDIGLDSQIKWPNDIVVNGKKICGILTEMNCELNMINYIIMGIGINVNLEVEDIPEELKEKATSLKIVKGEKVNRKELLGLILNHFERLYDDFKNQGDLTETINICKENSALLNKEIQVIQNGSIRIGKAIDINKDGELIVKFDEGVESIISGEVSIRGLNSYI